jgi:hypothetical protein
MFFAAFLAAGVLTQGLLAAETAHVKTKAPVHEAKAKKAYKKYAQKSEMVARYTTALHSKAMHKAKIVGQLKKGQKVALEWCDSYDWCKLKGKNEFVAKYTLKPMHHATHKKTKTEHKKSK